MARQNYFQSGHCTTAVQHFFGILKSRLKMAVGKRSATGRRQGPCGQVRVGGVGMWASWAFCKLVHISMLTPHLSIKMLDNRNISHHIMGQRAARQFGDGMLENFKISSILLHIGPFLRISALSQPRLAWVVKSFLSRCVTPARQGASNQNQSSS